MTVLSGLSFGGEFCLEMAPGCRRHFWWIRVQTVRSSAPQSSKHSVSSPLPPRRVSGAWGGTVGSVVIETQIRFSREEGGSEVVFHGQYATVTDLEAIDMSVLGRDIIGLFALIVDRPGDVVCFIGQRHRYVIEEW